MLTCHRHIHTHLEEGEEEEKMMMIDAACRQSSYLLPLLTNTTNITNNKMKRNATTNDHDDELLSTSLTGMKTNQQDKKFLSPRKKLKFGVGDGNLQYYIYNWKCPQMNPEKVALLLQ